MKCSGWIVLLLGLMTNHALATDRVVSSFKPLLMQALYQDEPVNARLTGKAAFKIRNETQAPSDTPVHVKVSTFHVYSDDCKRLTLEISTPEHFMQTRLGTSEPFQMWYQINLCKNGQPPSPALVAEAGL